MTFSLVGRCARSGQLGAAVATSSIAVGARCTYCEAGVGAVLTQHRTFPVRSAHLLVVGHESFPLIDLRVDWHDTPIAELRALWQRYEPESNAYLLRALDPENPAIL